MELGCSAGDLKLGEDPDCPGGPTAGTRGYKREEAREEGRGTRDYRPGFGRRKRSPVTE